MHLMTRKRYIVLGAIILLMLVVSGCQAPPAEVQIKEVEVKVTVVVEPTAVPPEPTEVPADQTEYHVAWESGPHST